MNKPRAAFTLLLLALPLTFMIASLVLRHTAGEGWIWRHMDPDYFYLFDGLNVINMIAPHHIYHPGVPLSMFVGLVLKAAHPLLGGEAVAATVIASPEFHLALVSTVLISLNALAMLFAGWMTHAATGSLSVAALVQLGPLLSMLTVKFGLRVKPEALLITTTLVMAALVMVTLRPEVRSRHRLAMALLFGIVAGFGVANKIVAAPLLFLVPVFLLGTWRAVFVFWATAGGAALVFFLPAVSEAERFFAWIVSTGKAAGDFGAGPQTVFDFAEYLRQFRRMLSRTAVSVPLILGLLVLAWGWLRQRKGLPMRFAEWRALAGLTLAVLVQAAIVAVNPSSHYMIPAFSMGGLSLALSVRLVTDPMWWSGITARRVARGASVLVLALLVAQAFSLMRADKDFQRFRSDSLSLDTTPFRNCAQVFFYPASHPDYALLMGHHLSGYRYGKYVKENVGESSYYLSDWLIGEVARIRNADGPVLLKDIMSKHRCTVFRGGHEFRLHDLLRSEGMEGLTFDAICSSPYEKAYTVGVSCAKP